MKLKSLLRTMLLLCALVAGGTNAWAGKVTDVINNSATSSTVLGSTADNQWKTVYITGTSGAQYTIYSMGTKNTTNALKWNANGYLYTTASGGRVSKVTITTTANKNIGLYAATTAYNAAPSGNALATIAATSSGASYTFDANTNYTYIALKGTASSTLITSIEIEWEIPDPPTFSVAAGDFNDAFDLVITAATGCTLKYTTDGSDPSTSQTAVSIANNTTAVSIPTSTTRVRAVAVKYGKYSTELDATYTYVDNSKENPTFTLSPSSLTLEVQEEGTLTLTTNSDGNVTFTSSDPTNLSVDNSVDPKVATVSSEVAGNYTITVTVAASATYNEKSEIVNVTINKKSLDGLMAFAETTPTINLFDTKTYEQTVSGLPADFASSGGSVVYSITSTVATITGSVVTASAVGSATVTASASGSSLYNDYETSYTLTITKVLPAGVVLVETFDDQGGNGNFASNKCDNDGWTSSGSAYQGTNAVRLATGSANGSITTPALNVVSYGKVTIIAKGWSDSEKGALTLTGANCTLGTTSISNIPNSNTEYNILFTVTGSNPKITFEAPGGNRTYIDNVVVIYDDFKASVSDVKYATFCDGIDRDFSASGITVYAATATASSVVFDEVTDGIVPANTGVVLYSATAVNNVAIPVATTAATYDFSDNEMVGVNARTQVDATASTKTNYILANGGSGVGFYKAVDGKYLAAHKAYLSTATAAASRDFLGFENEANSITTTNLTNDTNESGIYYNLAGQRVAQPTKGLYIVNGKKHIVK